MDKRNYATVKARQPDGQIIEETAIWRFTQQSPMNRKHRSRVKNKISKASRKANR